MVIGSKDIQNSMLPQSRAPADALLAMCDLALAALSSDGTKSEEGGKLQPDYAHVSSTDWDLQKLILLRQIQQSQLAQKIQLQQTILMQLKQAVCAGIGSGISPASPNSQLPCDVARRQGELILLQHLSALPPAQIIASCPTVLPPFIAPAPIFPSPVFTETGNVSKGLRPAPSSVDDRGNGRPGRRRFHEKAAVACLQEWLFANVKNPYPCLDKKRFLARQSGLTEAQIDHWFNNARKRLIKAHKPKIENVNPYKLGSSPVEALQNGQTNRLDSGTAPMRHQDIMACTPE
jgi:hypothetical protein